MSLIFSLDEIQKRRYESLNFKSDRLFAEIFTLIAIIVVSISFGLSIFGVDIEDNQQTHNKVYITFLPLMIIYLGLSYFRMIKSTRRVINGAMLLILSMVVSMTYLDILSGDSLIALSLTILLFSFAFVMSLWRVILFIYIPLSILAVSLYLSTTPIKPSLYFELFMLLVGAQIFSIILENKRRKDFVSALNTKIAVRMFKKERRKNYRLQNHLINAHSTLEKKVSEKTAALEHAKTKLEKEVIHDSLTGLLNRRYLYETMTHLIEQQQQQPFKLAMLFIDLDNFKDINDSYGHKTGDNLLVDVSHKLTSITRETDLVCRMGGDEFVVVVKDYQSKIDIERLGQKLLEQIDQLFLIDKKQIQLGCSIGICYFPDHGQTLSEILSAADLAMYSIKKRAKNGIAVFKPAMREELNHRLQLSQAMKNAITNNEFFMLYQPKIDLKTKEVMGCEALIRWKHPDHGLISPAEFIPIAEENGQILDIGSWIISEVLKQVTNWQCQGLLIPNISINLSAKQLENPHLLEDIFAQFAGFNLNPNTIEFELTETTIMNTKSSDTIDTLNLLKSLGHKISIDDFGTGYSSLSYLCDLPVDIIKIDRNFIRNLGTSSKSKAIVRATVYLAKTMGLSVIAEGIETDVQEEFLIQNGCLQGQGFKYAKPLTAEEMITFSKGRLSVDHKYKHQYGANVSQIRPL